MTGSTCDDQRSSLILTPYVWHNLVTVSRSVELKCEAEPSHERCIIYGSDAVVVGYKNREDEISEAILDWESVKCSTYKVVSSGEKENADIMNRSRRSGI